MDQSTACLCAERWPMHMVFGRRSGLELLFFFFFFLGESNHVDVFVGFEMSVLLTTAIFIVSPFNVGHYHTDGLDTLRTFKRDSWHLWGWEEVRTGDEHVVSCSWLSVACGRAFLDVCSQVIIQITGMKYLLFYW